MLTRPDPPGALPLDPDDGRRRPAVVRPVGPLDLASDRTVVEAVRRWTCQGYGSIDLDLSDVPFCDTAGLDVLLAARDAADAAGARLVVREPCWSLRTLMDVLGLSESLHPDGPGVGSPR